jgi:hypothetical protein
VKTTLISTIKAFLSPNIHFESTSNSLTKHPIVGSQLPKQSSQLLVVERKSFKGKEISNKRLRAPLMEQQKIRREKEKANTDSLFPDRHRNKS